MTSWMKGYGFHCLLSPLFVLNPCRSSKIWVEPIRLLVFIAPLISILSISTDFYGVWIEGRGVP
jgi:hypothetical protein